MFRIKGQSTLEYTVLVLIVMGAFIAASDYIKRGIQGRWKSAVDDLGDQYDPRTTNSDIIQAYISNSEMKITTYNVTGGVWTLRSDTADSLEIKQGGTIVGGN